MLIETIISRIRDLPPIRLKKPGIKSLITGLVAILFLYVFIFIIENIKEFQLRRKMFSSPSPSPTPVEEIFAPSPYATDSAVLGVEENLKTLEKDLLETDLYETSLNPPVLDMEVGFKE